MATKKLSSTTTVKSTTGPDGREITNTIVKPPTGGTTLLGYSPYRMPVDPAVAAEVAAATKRDAEEAAKREAEAQLSEKMTKLRKAALDKPTPTDPPDTLRDRAIKAMHAAQRDGHTYAEFEELAETGVDGLTITLQANGRFLVEHADLESPVERPKGTLRDWWRIASL